MPRGKKSTRLKRRGPGSITAQQVVVGGAQLTRVLKDIRTITTSAAVQTAATIGDGNAGAGFQPDLCPSWTNLANSWQEYRVKSIKVTAHAQSQNPGAGAAAATPIGITLFQDRSGQLTVAQIVAATQPQGFDQENSRFKFLWVNEPSHVLTSRMWAKDSEDFAWSNTQLSGANRFQICAQLGTTGVASTVSLTIEYHCEFKGRANGGLVELTRRAPTSRMLPDEDHSDSTARDSSSLTVVTNVRPKDIAAPAQEKAAVSSSLLPEQPSRGLGLSQSDRDLLDKVRRLMLSQE